MKTLFYLPMVLLGNLRLMLPRMAFIAIYNPSSEVVRDSEHQIRNAAGLASYKAKKLLGE